MSGTITAGGSNRAQRTGEGLAMQGAPPMEKKDLTDLVARDS